MTIGLQASTKGLWMKPNFSVVGVGKSLGSFQMDVVRSHPAGGGVKSVIDLKNNEEVKLKDGSYDVGIQLVCYARQQFYEQPNRLLVDSLVVSYQFCFDRTGPSFLDCIYIHVHPVLFVEVLLMFADDVAIVVNERVRYGSVLR